MLRRVYSNIMLESDFSRRKFLRTAAAGASGSLIMGITQAESSAGEPTKESGDLTEMSLAEAVGSGSQKKTVTCRADKGLSREN